MNRKIAFMLFVFVSAVCLCACSAVTVSPSDNSYDSSGITVETSSSPSAERYVVNFDENEVFADKTHQKAAQHIDPYIIHAVKLMNTVGENKKTYDVLSCDYSNVPKARDSITNQLSLEMYDIMLQKVSAFEDYSFDSADYGRDIFNEVVTANDAFRLDYPDLQLYCDLDIDGELYHSAYYMPGEWIDTPCSDRSAIKNEVAFMDAVIDRIMEKMPQNLTDWEKCRYFAFVIATAVEYDSDFETLDCNYPVYNAMVKGTAVCNGYAMTFYRLCQHEDIACWYCLGQSPYDLGYHAWNMVETTEGPIYIDVTWYDEEDISDSYRDGKIHYLFMSQEDFDYYGYKETGRRQTPYPVHNRC